MSLIPFIIDLADELHELGRCLANGVDIDDFGFGIYAGNSGSGGGCNEHLQSSPHQHQNVRRPRTTPLYWLPSKRHHPYCRNKPACCHKLATEDINAGNPLERETSGAGGGSIGSGTAVNILNNTNNNSGIGIGSGSNSTGTLGIGGTPGKSAAYSVVNRNGFQVSMNVKQFAPNELAVKTINNCIVVEGRHDDKEDGHGVISRHFVRKYMLPKGYDPNDVTSTLSSDGILTVRAPPPPIHTKNSESNERIVEIQPFSGPAQLISTSSSSSPLTSSSSAAGAAVTKEKDNVKEPAKSLSTINPSTLNQITEQKLKLDQQQPIGYKIAENKLNDLLREEREQPQSQPSQYMSQQQQQQQNEYIDTMQNTVQHLQQQHHQKKIDENFVLQNNADNLKQNKIDAVVIAAVNIENVQENCTTKFVDNMSVDFETETEVDTEATMKTIPDSSSTTALFPAKPIETDINKAENLINNNYDTKNDVEMDPNHITMQDNNEGEQQQQKQQQQLDNEVTANDAETSKMDVQNVKANVTTIISTTTTTTTTTTTGAEIIASTTAVKVSTTATTVTDVTNNNECYLPASGIESSILSTNDQDMMLLSDAKLNVNLPTLSVSMNPINLTENKTQVMIIDGDVEDHVNDHINNDGDIEMKITPAELVTDDPIIIASTTTTKTATVEDEIAVLKAAVMTSNATSDINTIISNSNNISNCKLENDGIDGHDVAQDVSNANSSVSSMINTETATSDSKEHDELFIKNHLINTPTAKTTPILSNNKEITN